MSHPETIPAPVASSPTIPVPRPTLTEEVERFDRRCAELRERARDEARALRRLASEHALPLSTADRASLNYHLDHAVEFGHLYGVFAALDVLRSYLPLEGA